LREPTKPHIGATRRVFRVDFAIGIGKYAEKGVG